MNTFVRLNLFIGIILVCFSSCKSDETKSGDAAISTDVINVPASASEPAEPGSAPEITFAEEKHDFGKVMQGEVVSYSFAFRNTGGSDLVISTAQGSCGCTVPNWPKEPIKPGGVGKIDVKYDSHGKSGLETKTVTLTTNCNPSTRMLTISTTVIVPEEE